LAFLLVVAAALLLGGLGGRIMESYQGLGDPNTLAALSLAVSGVPASALPVTILDIDDETREAWKARPQIPHAALARLIGIASEQGASGIVVDVDLSGDRENEAPDSQLHSLLAGYAVDAPPLLLARRIVFSAGADGRMEPTSTLSTPYDAIVRGKPNIQWITTLNDIDRDRTVRRVRLWQSICGESEDVAYPSAVLVTGALLLHEREVGFSLQQFLAERAAADCNATAGPAVPWRGAQLQAATVPFIVPDRAEARALFRIVRNGEETIVLRKVSAGQIVLTDEAGARLAGEIDRHPFAGRVVLIGASDAASGDLYNTPFGTMPGVLVIANSVVQADRILNAGPMPSWARSVATLLAFLSFFYVARRFHGAVAAILMSLMIFCLLYVIARLFSLGDGLAVIATAFTGLALFKLLESLFNLALDIPKRGWRAVFKE
jgi:CHASE2 domain-containing sensor protein